MKKIIGFPGFVVWNWYDRRWFDEIDIVDGIRAINCRSNREIRVVETRLGASLHLRCSRL
ncbi:hypothetical protein H6F89_10740 [Cyanobacteria bacterium FACHB-63]|nr:hypothetical protein [Cyanobacteria bacterium FACHB-63]